MSDTNVFTQQSKKRKLAKQQMELIDSNVARMVIFVLAGAQGERASVLPVEFLHQCNLVNTNTNRPVKSVRVMN